MTTERLRGFSQVTACVFDAYGTLFDVHSAVRHGGAALEDKATAVSELWRQKQLEYTWLRSLMGAHAEFRQVTSDSLEFALAASGVVDAALHEKLMGLYLTLDAYGEVAATLAALRDAGLAPAILSNGSPEMLEAAVPSAGPPDPFGAVLSVGAVGVQTPHSRPH